MFLAAHARNSWADGPGLENGVNKNRQVKPSEFTIHAVDKNGNPKTTGLLSGVASYLLN